MSKIAKRNSTRKAALTTKHSDTRLSRGRRRAEATFPVAQSKVGLPPDYAKVLAEIKERIQQTRLRVVLAANYTMVLLYWDIGRVILKRQNDAGWGAKVIDRLSADLREAYPDQQGYSPRNLKYMRAFAAAWPKAAIVQRVVAQLPWRLNIALLEKLERAEDRLWYAQQTIKNGWSQSILLQQIQSQLHHRHEGTLGADGYIVASLPQTSSCTNWRSAAHINNVTM